MTLLLSMGLVVWSYVVSKSAIEARWNHDHVLGERLSKQAWGISIGGGWALFSGALSLIVFAWRNLVL